MKRTAVGICTSGILVYILHRFATYVITGIRIVKRELVFCSFYSEWLPHQHDSPVQSSRRTCDTTFSDQLLKLNKYKSFKLSWNFCTTVPTVQRTLIVPFGFGEQGKQNKFSKYWFSERNFAGNKSIKTNWIGGQFFSLALVGWNSWLKWLNFLRG